MSNSCHVAGYCAENAAVVVQVVATAIPECADPDDVSCTVRAFMELPVELIEMLEKILHPSATTRTSKNASRCAISYSLCLRGEARTRCLPYRPGPRFRNLMLTYAIRIICVHGHKLNKRYSSAKRMCTNLLSSRQNAKLDVRAYIIFSYPYRGLPAIRSHIAPLYAVWNAGPKLTEKGMPDIPGIARHFCEFVEPDSPAADPLQTQPTRPTDR